ncbi:MAG: DnaD domain protein, partial [Oscillospiraceae bacterium]|nr:DnaD domain protein [Oscillospiraceae bacterium]
PGVVADYFLRLANEVQLKILLYLLRSSDTQLSTAQIAAFLKIEEEQVDEALQFWAQANVLELDGAVQSFPFAVPTTPVQPEIAVPSAQVSEQTAAVQRSSRDIKLDPSEIAAMLDDSQELRDLFALSEKMMGRPLNHMEHRSLLWIHTYLNIRSEVILTLLGYCISIEKYSISYVESIAIRWESEGILTLVQAEAEIQRMKKEHTYIDALQKMFEMKRKPTTQQRVYIDAWQTAGYSMELLQYAYEITIENIEKLNFKYMNMILEGWAQQGATTLEQAKALRMATVSKSSRKRKQPEPLTSQEVEEMNDYLSLVNRFKEDEEN